MAHPIQINQCPFCGGTEFVKGYQGGYGAVAGITGLLTGQWLYHVICRNCGSVVHSYVDNPEKLLNRCDRRKNRPYGGEPASYNPEKSS